MIELELKEQLRNAERLSKWGMRIAIFSIISAAVSSGLVLWVLLE